MVLTDSGVFPNKVLSVTHQGESWLYLQWPFWAIPFSSVSKNFSNMVNAHHGLPLLIQFTPIYTFLKMISVGIWGQRSSSSSSYWYQTQALIVNKMKGGEEELTAKKGYLKFFTWDLHWQATEARGALPDLLAGNLSIHLSCHLHPSVLESQNTAYHHPSRKSEHADRAARRESRPTWSSWGARRKSEK